MHYKSTDREGTGQWSTGLGFDGLLQKACLVVGLSMPMDKPIAKCRNCDRESSGSQILVLDSELNESGSLISPFKDILGYNHKNDEDGVK
jgi:hypothetical protein